MKTKEEVNKDKQRRACKGMNPMIFVGLEPEAQKDVIGIEKIVDPNFGWQNKLQRILEATTYQTGYTATQLKQKTKGRIGLSTARQAMVHIMVKEVGGRQRIGDFIGRNQSAITIASNEVEERLGKPSWELLTTTYNLIKQKI